MLKGDLVSTPLPEVLRQLADGVASGCLHVDDGVGGAAKVFLRGGQVYAVQVPGRRPQLGARLVSSGSLGPEALAEALEAQRTELQGWRLGELLVHLGYVDQPVVEAFIHEQVREQTSDLMRWPTGTWKFRVNERTREDVAPPTPVEDLLSDIAERQRVWETITEVLHGADAVPMLSAAGQSDAEMAIDPEAWSLLCKVDGHRTLGELARECGFTLFEAGQVVYTLVRSGLLEVEEVVVGPEAPAAAGSIASRLAAAFAPSPEVVIPAQAEEPSRSEVASLIAASIREDRTAESLAALSDAQVDGSIDRVSAALSALLGPTTDESLFDAPKPRRPKVAPLTPEETERAAKKAERAIRDAKRREKDAAELATAQAELEAGRAADAQAAEDALPLDHEAEIVSLDQVREEAARAAAEEAENARLAQEAAEAEALAAAEAQRLADEAEAQRLADEAEALAAAEAEAQRLADEQAALDAENARLAAEEAENARLAQEAAEAEAVAAAEAQRLAEEHAAAEAAEEQAARARVEEELRLAAQEQAAAQAAAQEQADAAEELERQQSAQDAVDRHNEEQVRLTAQRAEAGSAFAELSAAAASSSDVQVLQAPVAEAEDPQDEPEDFPAYKASDTDMASLFRELSSLGMEDAPEPPPTRPAGGPARPAAPAAPPKKKKGLFGR